MTFKSRPWAKPRPSTFELAWMTLQLKLAHGKLEAWEIPLQIYGEDGEVEILSIEEYLRKYRESD